MRSSPPSGVAFSERTHFVREPNSWARAVARAQEAMGEIIDLSDTNVSRLVAPPAPAAIERALEECSRLVYEPTAFGSTRARATVVEYYARRSIVTSLDSVLLVASTSEAYDHLFRLLADPGDEVLVPSPSYPLLEHLARLADVKLVPYPLAYDGTWHLPPGAIEERLNAATRAIVVISPNNPTGSFFEPGERTRVMQLAEDHGLPIISDEVFADYLTPPHEHQDASFIGETRALVFSLGGLSKSAGLPQMKAGWIIVSGPEDARTESVARLEIALDAQLSLSAPAEVVLQHVLPEVDTWQENLRCRLAENRAELDRALLDGPARRRHGQGGWMAIVDLPDLRSDEDWALHLLEQHRILGQPGYFFDLLDRPCLVVALLAPPKTFAEGARRLAEGVRGGSS